MELTRLLDHTTTFEYHYGKLAATRADLTDAWSGEPDSAEIQSSVSVGIETHVVEVQLSFRFDNQFGLFDILLKGRWTVDESINLTVEQSSEAVQAFSSEFALPRLLAIVQARVISMSHELEIPAPSFPLSLEETLTTQK